MSQINIAAQTAAVAGMISETVNPDIITKFNASVQTDKVTITAADAITTLTINGTAFTVNAGAAAASKNELVGLLIAAVNAGSEPVEANWGVAASDTLYITSDEPGVAVTLVGTANCSVASIQPNEASLAFGLGVVQDVIRGDEYAHKPISVGTMATHQFLGVSIRSINKANDNNTGYASKSAMDVLRKGKIWVVTDQAVNVDDPVYCRAVAGAGEVKGSFRKDADTADAGLVKGARFVGTYASGLALAEFNLPTTL